MKNIKLLMVTFLFSSVLSGCGMKGPLYKSQKTPPAQAVAASEVIPMVKENDPLTEAVSTIGEGATKIVETPQVIATTNNNANISAIAQPKEIAKMQEEQTPDKLLTTSTRLLAISPEHFTVQLAAMNSLHSLGNFAKMHNLPQKNVYIYQAIKNNKPIYVVIYGDYASHQLAKAASETLPNSLADIDSWIKKYQLVHQDLLNNR